MNRKSIKDAGIGFLILSVFLVEGLLFLWLLDVCSTVLQRFLKDQFAWHVSRNVALLLVPLMLGAVGFLSKAMRENIAHVPQFFGSIAGKLMRSARQRRELRHS